LRETFQNHNYAELKEGIFSGSQIREIINDELFEPLMVESEKSAWLTYKAFCLSFFGNVIAENYKELVEDLLNACQTVIENSFLLSHLDFFPPKAGTVNDEHGKSFHHYFSTMKDKYAGKSSQNMLADCY
jgi:hypothetical protein